MGGAGGELNEHRRAIDFGSIFGSVLAVVGLVAIGRGGLYWLGFGAAFSAAAWSFQRSFHGSKGVPAALVGACRSPAFPLGTIGMVVFGALLAVEGGDNGRAADAPAAGAAETSGVSQDVPTSIVAAVDPGGAAADQLLLPDELTVPCDGDPFIVSASGAHGDELVLITQQAGPTVVDVGGGQVVSVHDEEAAAALPSAPTREFDYGMSDFVPHESAWQTTAGEDGTFAIEWQCGEPQIGDTWELGVFTAASGRDGTVNVTGVDPVFDIFPFGTGFEDGDGRFRVPAGTIGPVTVGVQTVRDRPSETLDMEALLAGLTVSSSNSSVFSVSVINSLTLEVAAKEKGHAVVTVELRGLTKSYEVIVE